MKSTLFLTAAALSLCSSAAFTTPGASARPVSSLSMSKNDGDNNVKTFAASALAAACILTSVASADAAFAMDAFDGPSAAPAFTDSSSVLLAGRSGGRAGGRSMPRRAPMRQAPAATRTINRTTVIHAPPVVVGGYGGGYGGYGGGYGYGGGLGLNLGFSAVNAIGNGMRESRQNDMIYQERAELGASREREAEMAAKIRQLEMMQMQQSGGGQQQAQPQVIIAQPPAQLQVVPAAAQ
eukprot:CAMPEP_0172330808 /NCGR_PEP_ID=MMETSP1058-20130122/61593_1 /TAXON_ID=83371 /ORGANISM="Detonula confervacea, Strain CCMP 353" /LENGTH=237 /DNA_ID=CAMNT_0013048037 /DNA_START=82 /DNA_END=795 /DNA_ORIENTATION=+